MMQHIDPDLRALMALGEPDLPRAAGRHLEECEYCQSEIAALSRVARLARTSNPLEQKLEMPSGAVWDRIDSELATLPDAVAEDTSTHSNSPSAHLVPRRSRRRLRRRWLLPVACLLALAIGVGGTTLVLHPWGTAPKIEQEAALKPLPAWAGASGTAWLESTKGQTDLVVDLAAPSSSSGFREVWLMSSDLTKGISVGLLSGGSGRFVLPPSIRLSDYPVVDISQEPTDGNLGHSGDSIVRGKLS